jgi:PAS domain-containing protein
MEIDGTLPTNTFPTAGFDLSGVGRASLLEVLDALPLPVILVDRDYTIVFCNEACATICADYRRLEGRPFTDLAPRPLDEDRARLFAETAKALLTRAFTTGVSQSTEGVLEIDRAKLLVRYNLRSIVVEGDIRLLVLINNITSQKARLKLAQREVRRLRDAYNDLLKRVQEYTDHLADTTEKLSGEIESRLRAQRWLHAEKMRFERLCRLVPFGLAIIGRDEKFHYLDHKFEELFGYDMAEAPDAPEFLREIMDNPESKKGSLWEWLGAKSLADGNDPAPPSVKLTDKNGEDISVVMKAMRLDTSHFLVAFRERSEETESFDESESA